MPCYHGVDFSEDCDEILEEYAKDITSLAAIQYEAIMTRALGKVPDIESIHLYPLLPMRGKLLEMNLQALTRSIQKLTIYYPDLIIYFYAMHPVATLPKTGVWRKTASAIRKSMYVERQLFTKGPRKDEIFYTIEREKGLGN